MSRNFPYRFIPREEIRARANSPVPVECCMFSLFGAPALSQFRLDQLLRVLKAEEPKVSALTSRWVHFLDTSRQLTDPELDLLGKLLSPLNGARTDVDASKRAEREAAALEDPIEMLRAAPQ